ncbi:MAG: polysaccharide deacetylase family sporulation protein PdaB [Bacillota bacterium]|nr:MAG: polysaccharide deacetylase family sporulation protein PdaB [Bacillota bacterium]
MLFVTVSHRTKQAVKLFVLLVCVVALARVGLAITNGELAVVGRLQPIRNVTGAGDRVAVTFDISWGEVMPPKVLAVLKEYGVTCTFFLSGPWASSHPELVSDIVRDGHEIASHGYRHVNMSTLTKEAIEENIKQAHEAIKEASGVEPDLLRPPNGDYNNLVIETAQGLGYKVIEWGLDSHDWMNPGVTYIVKRVLDRAKSGDIVLMHASDTCRQTDQALPAILEGLAAKGVKVVTVGELLEGAGTD